MSIGEIHAKRDETATPASHDSHSDGMPPTAEGIGGGQQKTRQLGVTDSAREAFVRDGFRMPTKRMSVKAIKAAVRKRDGYLCRNCKLPDSRHTRKEGCRLDVHRIYPGKPYIIEACVTLCRECHISEHRLMGRRKKANPFAVELATELQFEVLMLAIENRTTPPEYMQGILKVAIKEQYAKYEEAKKAAASIGERAGQANPSGG
jgi:hypothetical protein